MIRHHVFGPVASRRLGVSLGVDFVPRKTCSLDCVYCEAQRTTCLTAERREYVPVDEVLRELDEVLAPGPELDFITFSGAGEPTLNSGIGRVVEFLKERYSRYPICLLTNGCSLGDEALRREIARVDRVVPSLDASNEEEFRRINRPAPELDYRRIVADLIDFTHRSSADIYLELFILPGVNDSDESIARFAEIISKMRLSAVQLNTLDRPGTESWVTPSPPENTRRFIRALEPLVPVEAVGPFRYRSRRREHSPEFHSDAERAVLDLVERRPATTADLTIALGRPQEEIQILLDNLFQHGFLEMEKRERGIFYAPARR